MYDFAAWKRQFEDAREEADSILEVTSGTLPSDISGTYFRNGGGKFRRGNDVYKHPFDGDGMVTAVTFRDGAAYYRNRLVRTAGLEREERAGRRLYRGFGNLEGGFFANAFNIKRKNLANTNVIFWGGKLLALWEAGVPHKLDPKSLETFGTSQLGGALGDGDVFSAHPRFDRRRNRLVNFGIKTIRGSETLITVYEFDDKFRPLSRREHKTSGFALIHDFALTDKYCIFFKVCRWSDSQVAAGLQ
ncbi:unnamed protein product, partial [Phaeothamnion confervicola]